MEGVNVEWKGSMWSGGGQGGVDGVIVKWRGSSQRREEQLDLS